ncbi:coiled-coil domain-containing protein 201-like [Ornithorhynchus anatinus]|uniref:coiled-coil domain-containing protein 201-like n=1 Tax=Ornithorhynchus anatinus TaxID=9258 RepID=UPI0019D49D59|nr:coiled-coil domain-containing protein 201-like [Ornithorhynchus anatinus]XP_039767660.1 coiled-coil domain-containing protein 201-like [Ornithorhynchus anatinus]
MSGDEYSFLKVRRPSVRRSSPVEGAHSECVRSCEALSEEMEGRKPIPGPPMSKTPLPEEPGPREKQSIRAPTPRKRLSTVNASEEPSDQPLGSTVQQEDQQVESSKKKAKASFMKKSRPGANELPGPRKTITRKMKKHLLKKKHTVDKVRQWELRQLKDIEEATNWELTIEME